VIRSLHAKEKSRIDVPGALHHILGVGGLERFAVVSTLGEPSPPLGKNRKPWIRPRTRKQPLSMILWESPSGKLSGNSNDDQHFSRSPRALLNLSASS